MLSEVLMTKISITKKDLKNLYKGKNIIVMLSEEQTKNTKEQKAKGRTV